VLFVDRQPDTLPFLASYVGAFAPKTDALRGTPDSLTYSVTPE
jgi:hypothetical protein